MKSLKFTIKQDGSVTEEIIGAETIPMDECLKIIKTHIEKRLRKEEKNSPPYEEIVKDALWEHEIEEDGLFYETQYYEMEHTSEGC